jgi:hypothetical protein
MKEGDIVKHRLTGERMLVASIKTFNCNPPFWPWRPQMATQVWVTRYVRKKGKYVSERFSPEELEEISEKVVDRP